MRSAGPRTRRQPGVGGHPGKLRVVAEHVELPRGRRLGTQHVALKTDAVHQVSDRRLRTGQVGVGLVVGSAHDLDPALGDEPAKIGAVLGAGVPVRLEVIHFSQHELVLGLAARHFQMRVHQFEGVGLPGRARAGLGPLAGVGALRVPPHRVVVEVADHEHRPPGLGHGERRNVSAGAAGVHLGGPPLTDDRLVDRDRNLDDLIAGAGDRLAGQAVAVDADQRRLGDPGDGDPDQLQRRLRRPDEQLGRLRRNQLHPRTLRRVMSA